MPSPDSTTNTNGAGTGSGLPSNGKDVRDHQYHEDEEPTSMMGSSDDVNVETYHHHEEEKRKHGRDRPRKRKLYAEVCKQMEFYFSDANITKNRNMREIIENANASSDGFVDLNVFLDFTRMHRLAVTINHIQKALVKSEKLELSSDLMKARRKVPFDVTKVKSDEAVEECTIYVENIPRDAEHEWIEKIFQTFGSVAYISLPKSKRGHHKGFAFVEFDDVDAARRCLEAYGEDGAMLPNDIDPSQLRSIQSFKEEQQTEGKSDQARGSNTSSDDNKNASKVQQRHKRKASGASEDSLAEPAVKKEKRTNSSSSSSEEDEKVTTTESLKTSSAGQDEVASTSRKSKKKRKKNKSKKTIEARLESESIMLKVLPKKSWRQLRNRYLNLQRSNMTKLKKHLKQEQIREQHYKNFYQPPEQPKHQHRHQDVPDEVHENDHLQLDHIIEITLHKSQMPESLELFRHKIMVELAEQDEDEAIVSGFVKFVDYTLNDCTAYVRINSDASFTSRAQNLLAKSKAEFASARFLSDNEVKEYKRKIQAALRQKLKEQPRKNIRGKDRLMKAATKSTHIRFESDSDGDDEGKKVQPKIENVS